MIGEKKPRKPRKAQRKQSSPAVFQPPKRQNEFRNPRVVTPERSGNAMPILGATIIAAAILLSTLITAVGTRFVGMETPNEESLWLVDRLTGNVFKCQAPTRGKAACEAEVATGSLGEPAKR
jgi:hypothetical protein